MTPNSNQMTIIRYLSGKESATLEELYLIQEKTYFGNWPKHFGDVMSRMVKAGMVVRIKRGVFKINPNYRAIKQVPVPENQLSLF